MRVCYVEILFLTMAECVILRISWKWDKWWIPKWGSESMAWKKPESFLPFFQTYRSFIKSKIERTQIEWRWGGGGIYSTFTDTVQQRDDTSFFDEDKTRNEHHMMKLEWTI